MSNKVKNIEIKNPYLRNVILILIGILFFGGGFFAFKTLGKTTYNLSFVIDSFEERAIEEIAEIKISRNGEEFSTLRGKEIAVNKGENIVIRLSLNDGYEPLLDDSGAQYLSATKTLEEKSSLSDEGYFEWQIKNINEDKELHINGINIKKLDVARPVFIDSQGNHVELEINGFQNTLTYGEKLKFKVNPVDGEKFYSIKEVKANIKPKSKILNLNSEITTLENGEYEISLYDETNLFGGIKSSINSIEIFVDELLESEISKDNDGESIDPIMYNLILKDGDSGSIEKLNEKIEVYLCNDVNNILGNETSIDAEKFTLVENEFDSEKNQFIISKNKNSKVIFYIKLKEGYNESNYVIEPTDKYSTRDVGIIIGDNTVQVKLYTINIDSDKELTINGLTKNMYDVNFRLKDEDVGDNILNTKLDIYKDSESPENKLSSILNIKCNYRDSLKYIIKPKEDYEFNVDDIKVGGIVITLSETEMVVEVSSVDSSIDITIPEIKNRLYNIMFQDSEGNPIPTDIATIKRLDGQDGVEINGGAEILSGLDLFKFKIDLAEAYSDDFSVNSNILDIDKSAGNNEFSLKGPIRSDVVITISNISNKKFDVFFTSVVEKYKGVLNIKYNEYVEESGPLVKSYYQVQDNTGNHAAEFGTNIPSLVPYGCDFEFTIEIMDRRYKIIADNIKDYINSNLIGSGITGIEAVNVKDNKIKVTLKNVTKSLGSDNSISITRLDIVTKNLKFKIESPEGTTGTSIENKVIVYSMSMNGIVSDENKSEVFNSKNNINNMVVTPDVDSYFYVEILEGCEAGSQGVSCVLTTSNSSYQINIDPDKGYFKIPGSKLSEDDDILITISGIKIIEPKVYFKGFSNATISQIVDGVESKIEDEFIRVDYGSNLNLSLKLDIRSDQVIGNIEDCIVVKYNNGSNDIIPIPGEISDKTYTFVIPKITADLTVEFKPQATERMIINFGDIEGINFGTVTDRNGTYNFNEDIKGTVSVSYGGSYTFAIRADIGYNLSTSTISANGTKIDKNDDINTGYTEIDSGGNPNIRVFKLNNITKNLDISGSIERSTYKINLKRDSILTGIENARDNITYISYYKSGEAIEQISVEHGGNAEFTISLEPRCNQSVPVVEVYVGDELKETLSSVSGTYRIMDIKEDMEVRVKGLTWNKYVLNFEKNSVADFVSKTSGTEEVLEGIRSVNYGDEFSFSVKARPGYSLGNKSIVQAVSSSGNKQELKKDSTGSYKLRGISDNYNISIENVDNVFYTLEFSPVDGVTYYNDQGDKISGKTKILYGNNFEFSVGIDDAYSDSLQGMQIIVNNSMSSNVQVQKLSSGRYLVQNITEDVNIKALNISKNKYTVTLTKDEGIEYLSISNKIITGDNEVYHGETFNFRVKLGSIYSDSNIRVMVGNKEISPNDEKVYSIENVQEGKTVTVVGIEKNATSDLVDIINKLPSTIKSDTDAQEVINATRAYNSLDEFQKKDILNYEVLQNLQEHVGELNHSYNGVTASGLPWNIKIIANPIIDNTDACSRIYEKVDNSYLLSLYDVYLVDTVTDRRYTLSEGQSIVITLPTPDMMYFERPTGIHENSNGKIDYLSLDINNETTSLETSALSPIGIIANRSLQPGRSSLIDAVDADISSLTDYTLGSLNSSKSQNKGEVNTLYNQSQNTEDTGESQDSEAEDTKRIDNSTTPLGSALKLTLILMCILIFLAIVFILIRNSRQNKGTK